MKSIHVITIFAAVVFSACGTSNGTSDAYGNFEAVEITISSEGNGSIKNFTIQEGEKIEAGQILGVIDTTQLFLKKQQLLATISALYTKLPDVGTQLAVYGEQLETAKKEKARFENLVASEAATQKQLDDIIAQVQLLERQIAATKSNLNTQSRGILAEIEPLKIQVKQVEDQINKSIISNPVTGTVLTKYAYTGELAVMGKPLYKIADIDNIVLRAYVSGEQLSQIKIGQKVTVLIDAPDGEFQEYKGDISWISSKAEFAPKIIQTKDERVNLVYAIKIIVPNEGSIKIGMPGEVRF